MSSMCTHVGNERDVLEIGRLPVKMTSRSLISFTLCLIYLFLYAMELKKPLVLNRHCSS